MFASRASIGVMGLGQTTPSTVFAGPVDPSLTDAYNAGLIQGAGGTSPFDLGSATAEQQAAFNSGVNAAQAQPGIVTTGPNAGVAISAVSSPVAPPPATTTPPATTPVVSNIVIFAIAGAAALFFIVTASKR